MRIEYSPESINDLRRMKSYITENFDEELASSIILDIMNAIDGLANYPDMGVSLSQQLELECDYFYLVAKKNYVFYRQENDCIKIVRVLNERQDFMYILFGIKSGTQESSDYWDE